MGAPVSLLGRARAFARDFPRDNMPAGYLWDIVDYVPAIVDAELTGRAGWEWESDVGSDDIETGIFANYLSGDQLLCQTVDGKMYIADTTLGLLTLKGSVPRAAQNPIQLFETVIHFDRDRLVVPTLIGPTGAPTSMDASAPKAKVGTIWRNSVVSDGGPGKEDTLRFCVPGEPEQPYDAAAFQETAGEITGLAAIRATAIVFHKGTIERLRGDEIPSLAADLVGNLSLEPLSSAVGCPEPKTIAYWQDNVVFADEHGVHMTDGATVRNLTAQGGISAFWRTAWDIRETVCAGTFLDYYVITIRSQPHRTPPPFLRYVIPPGPDFRVEITLICDLTRRQWFRFSNINPLCYIGSAGGMAVGSATEHLWFGDFGSKRLADLSPCFFPDPLNVDPITDADGTTVLPAFDTPWYRLTKEGRKRVRFVYLSYDARIPAPGGPALTVQYIRSPQDLSYSDLGHFPSTTAYRRFRLPVGQAPYGIAFRVTQAAGTSVLRVFDLAVEAQDMEPSRV